jgi:hypothetical protein
MRTVNDYLARNLLTYVLVTIVLPGLAAAEPDGPPPDPAAFADLLSGPPSKEGTEPPKDRAEPVDASTATETEIGAASSKPEPAGDVAAEVQRSVREAELLLRPLVQGLTEREDDLDNSWKRAVRIIEQYMESLPVKPGSSGQEAAPVSASSRPGTAGVSPPPVVPASHESEPGEGDIRTEAGGLESGMHEYCGPEADVTDGRNPVQRNGQIPPEGIEQLRRYIVRLRALADSLEKLLARLTIESR